MSNYNYEEEIQSTDDIEWGLEIMLDEATWEWEFYHDEKVVVIQPRPDAYRYEEDGSLDFSYSPDYEAAESDARQGLPSSYQIAWG